MASSTSRCGFGRPRVLTRRRASCAQGTLGDAQDERAAALETAAALRAQLEEARSECTRLEEEGQRLVQTSAALQAQCEELRARSASLERELDAAVPALPPPLKPPTPQKRGVRAWAAHREQRKKHPARLPPGMRAPAPRAAFAGRRRARAVPGGRRMTLPPTRSVPSRGSRPHPRRPRGCRRSRGSRSGRPAPRGTRHCRSRRARSPRRVRAVAPP